MRLQPTRPPGRIDRKAAAYASDIAELRRAGYTYEAIREALEGVGVIASTSALRREMRRLRTPTRPVLPTAPGPPSPAPAPVPAAPAGLPSALPAGAEPVLTVGRAGAEAFFSAHPSNPLFNSEETS